MKLPRHHPGDSERDFADEVARQLCGAGYRCVRELTVPVGGRADIAVYDRKRRRPFELIEVKVTNELCGIGQLLSYGLGGDHPTPNLTLLIPGQVDHPALIAVCEQTGIHLRRYGVAEEAEALRRLSIATRNYERCLAVLDEIGEAPRAWRPGYDGVPDLSRWQQPHGVLGPR